MKKAERMTPPYLSGEPETEEQRWGVGGNPIHGAVGGSVIDQHDLEVITLRQLNLGFKRAQALLQDRQPVVGGDDDADEHMSNLDRSMIADALRSDRCARGSAARHRDRA